MMNIRSDYNQIITSVINLLDKSRAELIKENRAKLMKICSTVLLCARQMIALRGHEENGESRNRGNLIELLHWAASTDSLVDKILNDSDSNATYLSPTIQNEILKILADQIRRKISNEIKNRPFVLMADESKDISSKEQLSVVLRYVDAENQIHEHFMGFTKLDQFDAKALYEKLYELLMKHDISIQDCIGQCYDGASVMSGRHAGVQTLMRQNYMPRGVYIHCFAHRLNLVICDVCIVVSYVDEFMGILSKIHQYFTSSSVNNEHFRHAQLSLQLNSVIFTTTIGQKDWGNQKSFHSNENKFRDELFYSLIDSILIELNNRFSDDNILLFSSVSAVHPSNQQFLEIEFLKPLASHLLVDFKLLENELNIVKHFIREKIASMKTIQDLLTELKPVNEAFPATISLLRGALCLPVSSTTCERSFSRMKLIKTYCRNSMGDECLSDLTLLAVERDFDIDLEETADIFSKSHKNGRILLS
ncbi:unnamed protein product [Rotaria magnacalcarata]|uniref:Zinc finger MYM-type protein 1-like n=1 Tax=Rotaria magnacalcarata TaxID=392030 RepID=A0A816ZMX3_9BILA|nr:unnamed protein product [Rotaria magnacalcarata]CAF2215832.1 unnamed protein product [Rotaria magnacalcarata]